MINLELYKIFYAVATEENITKASEKLHISQPAVTKQLKKLETMLNNPLFIRNKKGVILTEFGQDIFLKVKQALTLLDEVEIQAHNFSNLKVGTIKIGISTTLMRNFLLPYVEKFHHLYPQIIIDIYTDPTKILLDKLKNGTIDLIIGKLPNYLENDLTFEKLGTLNYLFITNKKYFPISSNIKAKDLEKYPILLPKEPSSSRLSALDYLKQNNVNITPKMNIASSNLLIDFVKMGYGIGFATDLYVKNELQENNLAVLNISPTPPKIPFGIIYLKNNMLSNICQLFIDNLKLK